ncbi:MAG TPA: biosynthetic-type acetolactate synthase large subunit, partial [Hyphomonas sp.]|nr:biosynthetic-type acetolactate synthase large subunit [Hyphomonas sp.]HAQ76034.1 biosynthetic-type acetolactate synthase large subunit [Hyphomonas sp.]HBL93649.1 biosynthetic-type acetolactate synthase large subunit [Hyphomonas sp.]HBX97004.1 biosynthetic-type acetolactate synthase large subunit [Hyphomonas sp.]HCJ15945.1 biosynthetic-type acetolactate synthase large subunit [Hyphomonas sp.]
CLVTSGPGATNMVTPIADAMMDSIPMVVLTGQVPTHLIGTDAFQECDTTGITRTCAKHNYLVTDVNQLARTIHEAFLIAKSGRPGPVVVDIPKDIQFATGTYVGKEGVHKPSYHPTTKPHPDAISATVDLMMHARRPVFYTGGGVINSGPKASDLLRELQNVTGYPVTSTLMGLGAFPASHPDWLGMVGMHGSFEANNAMHDCDLMICVGARFDDRVTGRIDAFSPNSKKVHIDIDPSSVNKIVRVDIPVIADCAEALAAILKEFKSRKAKKPDLKPWRQEIDIWRARKCFTYANSNTVIKPQHAVERLYELTRDRETYITTEVGQHQMWAAQFYHFDEPNRWMTSGGLGTMGYGLPAAVGVQAAHPDALVIDIAGEASIQMMTQELSTAVQHRLPVKVFILNNEWMGMVRQWQELLHGERYSHSYSETLPDFVKLAEAMGGHGIRCDNPAELDDKIREMIDHPGPVLFDCRVEKAENCLPMIPSGSAHNEMILGEIKGDEIGEAGKGLV